MVSIKSIVQLFILAILCGCSSWVLAESTITVVWPARPPFQYVENGVAKGVRLERAKQVFSLARLPVELIEEPAKRIWANFAAGKKNYCSFDWYKLPEREQIVQFSVAFEKTPPYSVLTNQIAEARVTTHKNLRSLMADPELTLGSLDSVSYGRELESMIFYSRNKQLRMNVLPRIMARMIGANRASYMFIDKREWEFMKSGDSYLSDTRILDLEGVPEGLDSFIVCSKDISTSVMAKLNAAIVKASSN